LGPTGSKATLLKEYRWTTKTTIFLRNDVLGTTGSKATLLNEYSLSVQWS
jgi:hypothetical protein